MPILAIANEIEIELTHKCNWNCPYCAINTHKLKPITIQQMFQKVESIPDNSVVTLSGGEPGTIQRKEICKVLSILEHKHCILNLNTNGLFLKRYSDLLHRFNQIIYHCSENLDANDVLIHVSANIDIRYMVIVTDDNVCKLDAFLNAHPGILFDIVQATYDVQTNQPTLSAKNRNMVVTKFANRMTKDSIRRMFCEKDWSIMKFI